MSSPTPPAPGQEPTPGTPPSGQPSGQAGADPGQQPQAPTSGNEPGQQQSPQPATGEKPPWEREGVEFDPHKAWQLVQRLRESERTLKGERDQHKAKLDEIDRGQMSAQQQAETDRDSYRGRAESAEWELARYEVAAEKGLDPSAMRFLTGSTREELATSADGLKALLSAQAPAAPAGPPPSRPTEHLGAPPPGGSDPGAPDIEMDPRKLAAQLPRGF